MPILYFIPIFLIYTFGLVNLFGIRPDLVHIWIVYFFIGLLLFFIIRFLQLKRHINFFKNHSFIFYVLTLLLLFLTLFLGETIKGSRRWLDLHFFPLQTSELFKIFFILYISQILALKSSFFYKKVIFFQLLIATIIPFIIILRQPDLATGVIIFAIFYILILNSYLPRKYLVFFTLLIILSLPIAWELMHDYQRNRILTLFAPTATGSHNSYNMTQAIITIGSGGFIGQGLGMGQQTQLSFLPEFHTDFAFSSLIEQFGFMGGAIILLLYVLFFAVLFVRILYFSKKTDADSRFNFYFTLGFSFIFISQTIINIAMNLGIFPIAGITLPFISYGGSSLITFMIGLALLP